MLTESTCSGRRKEADGPAFHAMIGSDIIKGMMPFCNDGLKVRSRGDVLCMPLDIVALYM